MIHVTREDGGMNESAAAAHSPADLGERRAEVTRDAIRKAVTALMVQEHPSAVSVPAVAKRAGVSVRTVDRYYPNKQALLDDVARSGYRTMEEAGYGSDSLFRNPRQMLPVMWQTFANDLDWVRADHMSPVGRDLRDRRLGGQRAGVREVVDAMTDELSDTELDSLTDAIVAVTSSSMFLELHDRMGISAPDAAEIAIWIVDAILQRVASENGFNVTMEGNPQ